MLLLEVWRVGGPAGVARLCVKRLAGLGLVWHVGSDGLVLGSFLGRWLCTGPVVVALTTFLSSRVPFCPCVSPGESSNGSLRGEILCSAFQCSAEVESEV
jgi:hypothetical protein